VEIVVSSKRSDVTAERIVVPTGASYAQSICVGCARDKHHSGLADLDDVKSKVRSALEAAAANGAASEQLGWR